MTYINLVTVTYYPLPTIQLCILPIMMLSYYTKKAEIGINKLFNWFCANKLSLNSGKTKYIVIRQHSKQLNLNIYTLSINGTPLTRIGNNCKETAIKFLGIYIDEFLTWRKQLANINTKIARAIYSIKQLKHIFPL